MQFISAEFYFFLPFFCVLLYQFLLLGNNIHFFFLLSLKTKMPSQRAKTIPEFFFSSFPKRTLLSDCHFFFVVYPLLLVLLFLFICFFFIFRSFLGPAILRYRSGALSGGRPSKAFDRLFVQKFLLSKHPFHARSQTNSFFSRRKQPPNLNFYWRDLVKDGLVNKLVIAIHLFCWIPARISCQ